MENNYPQIRELLQQRADLQVDKAEVIRILTE